MGVRPTTASPLQLPVHLQPVDGVIVAACAGASFALLSPWARWAPGAAHSAAGFGLLAVGPLLLRWLEARAPRQRALRLLAAFWLVPVAALAHTLLNPLADAVGHPLRDAQLALLDAHLLGVQVALWSEHHTPRWLEDVLLLCYYGHFVWSLVLAGVLYARGEGRALQTFLLAGAVYFAANYTLYTLVPAVGPRFYLAGHFAAPLQGLWLAPRLAGLMMLPAYLRDCFPSGHTGLALLVLITAWRRARDVFWVVLAPCVGLVAATLVGRFHYAVDLAAALPLACAVAAAAEALYRRLPEAETGVARAGPTVPESEPQ